MDIFQNYQKKGYFLKVSSIFLISIFLALSGCGKKLLTGEDAGLTAEEKRRKNIAEGRGASLKDIVGGRGGSTNYEFSSSNPMWRASLETLDFLPLTTVDYSGGMIITDWYTNDSDTSKSVKITIRFLSNEVRSDSLKVIVHQRICKTINECVTNLMENSKIQEELFSVILRKASLFEKEAKEKKKKK